MADAHAAEPTRRDFLYVATSAFAAVGGAFALWPLIHQMNPDASTQALASTEVDLSPIEEGQVVTIMWRGKPVFVRNRTAEEVEKAKAVALDELPDPLARNDNLPEGDPATDANRAAPEQEKWLILVGICTHLGCIPLAHEGDFGGWFCPCHGSHYDLAGRIRKGPAPENLEVPPYEFLSDTRVRIG